MKFAAVFAVLLAFSFSHSAEAYIQCALYKEFGNISAPLIGVAEAAVLNVPPNGGAMTTIEFPTVSSKFE